MSEQIKIDDKYTYEFDDGVVSLRRNGYPWISTESSWGGITDPSGPLNAPKAWIAAANEIETLREQKASVHRNLALRIQEIEELRQVIWQQEQEIEMLKETNPW